MIDYLIHYYRKGSQPFRSLSALPDGEALEIMKGLYIEGSVFWERFKDPWEYLQARRLTEHWLREAFIAKGGQPQELYPVYMILGRSKWVERMGDPATLAATAEIQVPLSIFGEGDLSFTYPDSMVTLLMESQKNPACYQPDYHGKLFTRAEMLAIVAVKGLPEEGWETGAPERLAHYVEAQVWNLRPVRQHLERRV